ncbi:MAG: DUF1735 and LamG domain-containing protein [Rikenellaceae bacterium]|nr:DUF1735 and LamG domain-containing protein [Rikenellaceae bacterium]
MNNLIKIKKMKTIRFVCILFSVAFSGVISSCDDGYEYYDGIYISSTLGITPTYTLNLDDDFPKVLDLTVASSKPVQNDVQIYLEAAPSLVEGYNQKYGTNYLPLPEQAYVLTHPVVTIKKGNFSTQENIQFKALSKDGFEIGESYMMPVTIKEISGGETVIEASRTIYIALHEIIVRSAVNLGSGGYLVTKFSENTMVDGIDLTSLSAVTFEIRCKIDRYLSDSFNGIMGLEENLAVRLSTYDGAGGRLEATGAGMGNISSGIPFPLNSWQHIAVTYEGDADGNGVLGIYINGEVSTIQEVIRKEDKMLVDLTERYGSLAPGYDYMIGNQVQSRYMNGAVSEGRVWAKALTQAEIRNNMCAVNPESDRLIAYWYFDEEGNTFADATGHGFTMGRYIGTLTYETVRCPED